MSLKSTYNIAPSTRHLRNKLLAPFSFIIQPLTETLPELINSDAAKFPRCNYCRSYFSNFCTFSDGKWKCAVCGKTNEGDVVENIPESENFYFQTDEGIDDDILVFYISMEFHEDDIKIIADNLTDLLNTTAKKAVLFVISNYDGCVSYLTPPVQTYQLRDRRLLSKTPTRNIDQYADMPAPFARYSSYKDISIDTHIFSASQFRNAILSFSKFTPSQCPFHFSTLSETILHISSSLPSTPIHVIAIIPRIPSFDHISIKADKKLLRVDFLTPVYDDISMSLQEITPGLVIPFSRYNMLEKLRFATEANIGYQIYMNARYSGCRCSWKPLKNQKMTVDGDLAHVATAREGQPFMLDAIPDGSAESIVQVTVKRENILIVLNSRIPITSSASEAAASIDIGNVAWCWVARLSTSPTPENAKWLFIAAAHLILELPTGHELKRILTSFLTCTEAADIFDSQNPKEAAIQRMFLSICDPSKTNFLPEIVKKTIIEENSEESDKHDNEFGVFLNQVYSEGINPDATKTAASFGLSLGVRKSIPDWVRTPTKSVLSKLQAAILDERQKISEDDRE